MQTYRKNCTICHFNHPIFKRAGVAVRRRGIAFACAFVAGSIVPSAYGSLHAAPLHEEIQALLKLNGKKKLDRAVELQTLDAIAPTYRRDIEKVGTIIWNDCLKGGGQLVLYPEKAYCTAPYDGEKFLANAGPDLFDPPVACSRNDRRRLPAGIVKWLSGKFDAVLTQLDGLAAQDPQVKPKELQSNGIRIIGAAFCDNELNLTDLQLSYPLVLDKAVLRFGVRAKGLKVGGNLSFAGSYVYENLAISDSTIGGTLFGRGAFIQKVRITNTEILDNIRFNRSILLNYAIFDRTKARGIDLSQTKLSTLNIRGGQIAERLNLTGTDAACKFQFENADINELIAIDTSLGKTRAPKGAASSTSRRTWSGHPSNPKMLETTRVKDEIAKAEDCLDESARFSMTGGTTRSLCLQDLRWTTPEIAGGPNAPSVMSFKNLTIADNMRLNLDAPQAGSRPSDASGARPATGPPRIEMASVTIATLIFDFNRSQSYRTAIDQIAVNRVRVARIECLTENPVSTRGSDVERVADWLKNNATSLQPFTAFIKAYDNIGADTTDLKIAKAAFEFDQTLHDRHAAMLSAWREKSFFAFLWQDSLHAFIDYLTFGLKWLLGFFTDFGFRPAQVIWVVIAIVAFSWVSIRLFAGIVAFTHEKKQGIRAVGWTFLFDRLLPIYRLRDEDYDIGAFYQRGSGENSKTIRYFGRNIECVPASPRRTRYIELYLDGLKALGIILAAFLVAAVNALIVR